MKNIIPNKLIFPASNLTRVSLRLLSDVTNWEEGVILFLSLHNQVRLPLLPTTIIITIPTTPTLAIAESVRG